MGLAWIHAFIFDKLPRHILHGVSMNTLLYLISYLDTSRCWVSIGKVCIVKDFFSLGLRLFNFLRWCRDYKSLWCLELLGQSYFWGNLADHIKSNCLNLELIEFVTLINLFWLKFSLLHILQYDIYSNKFKVWNSNTYFLKSKKAFFKSKETETKK